MNAQVARKPFNLGAQIEEQGQRRAIGQIGSSRSAASIFEGAHGRGDDIRLQAERFAGIADGAARAVGDKGAGHRRMFRAVALVHILDHLFAPRRIKIDVDIGHHLPLAGEEALKDEIVGDGIDGADVKQVSDQRIGRRSPPLAANPFLPREAHDIPDDQEIIGQARRFDDPQFMVELLLNPGRRVAEAGRNGLAAETAQISAAAHAVRRGEWGQILQPVVQIKTAAAGDKQAVGHCFRVIGKELRHLRRRFEEVFPIQAAQMGGGIERGQMADADQDILQPLPLRERVMHIVAGHTAQTEVVGQGGQPGDQEFIAGQEMALQLDPEAVTAE